MPHAVLTSSKTDMQGNRKDVLLILKSQIQHLRYGKSLIKVTKKVNICEFLWEKWVENKIRRAHCNVIKSSSFCVLLTGCTVRNERGGFAAIGLTTARLENRNEYRTVTPVVTTIRRLNLYKIDTVIKIVNIVPVLVAEGYQPKFFSYLNQ